MHVSRSDRVLDSSRVKCTWVEQTQPPTFFWDTDARKLVYSFDCDKAERDVIYPFCFTLDERLARV
jgi:hypothetical protein